MFSLQQFFGKGDKFLKLLEQAAEQARESVRLAVEIIRSPQDPKKMEELALSRRKEKKISQEISAELVSTFVTGLEREDIEALARGIYRIPKTAEKVAVRYLIAVPHVADMDFSKQAEMMLQAADGVLEMIRQLRNLNELEKIKELNDRLQFVETEADKFLTDLLRELYNGRHDPLKAIAIRDLYELIEKAVDRCHDVGNVVMQIVLKNS